MRTVIAGSRSIEDYALVKRVIESTPWIITGVITGGAPGVDRLADRWARENKLPRIVEHAHWKLYGLDAGPQRNGRMAQIGEALVAIWDGESPGTKDMIRRMRQKGVLVFVYNTTTNDGRLLRGGQFGRRATGPHVSF